MMIRRIVVSLFILSASRLSAASETGQPVYFYLFSSIEDHVNIGAPLGTVSSHGLSEERIERTLPLLERYRTQFPQYRVSAVYFFSGTTSENLAANRQNGLLSSVLDSVRRGVIEIGYDGSEEPTFVTRPRPDFRYSKTSRERWLARGKAIDWFLTEFKDRLSGEPDPSRSGGMKRTQEVLGEVVAVSGIVFDIGGDSEVVHHLKKYNTKAPIMPGIPEPGAYPAKNMHGYRGSIVMMGREVSPIADSSPELFYQDSLLRLSDSSGPEVRVVKAYEGPEVLKRLLDSLDRTRIHVIKVQMGHHGLYFRPSFANGRYETPLQYAYDNPKNAAIHNIVDAIRPRAEIDANYAREEETLKWLVGEYFPANPGSRFVSAEGLKRLAATSMGTRVGREKVAKAAADLLARWKEVGNNPPSFADAGDEYFSLADMFQMLAGAMASLRQTGALPDSILLTPVYGPLEMSDDGGPPSGSVTIAGIAGACSEISDRLNDQTWNPLPENMIPTWITVEGARLNAAQFLRLMSEAYISPLLGTRLNIAASQMRAPIGIVIPKTRPAPEQGSTWTLKPVHLRRLE